MEINIEQNTDEAIGLITRIARKVDPKFIKWLESSDYFIAPASTRFHGSEPGGLVNHSLQVYRRLTEYSTYYKLNIPEESRIIMGLFHDICKINMYKSEVRNRKVNGNWESYDAYTFNESFPLQHGPKSVILLQKYMKLNNEEISSISWHMGMYELNHNELLAYSNAIRKSHWVLALHVADVQANLIDNK